LYNGSHVCLSIYWPNYVSDDHISIKSGIRSLHQKLILVCISKHKPHVNSIKYYWFCEFYTPVAFFFSNFNVSILKNMRSNNFWKTLDSFCFSVVTYSDTLSFVESMLANAVSMCVCVWYQFVWIVIEYSIQNMNKVVTK
jgi:hypothetical protein